MREPAGGLLEGHAGAQPFPHRRRGRAGPRIEAGECVLSRAERPEQTGDVIWPHSSGATIGSRRRDGQQAGQRGSVIRPCFVGFVLPDRTKPEILIGVIVSAHRDLPNHLVCEAESAIRADSGKFGS